MLVWWTKPDESVGKPLPARPRERSHVVDVLDHHVPVHQRLCFRARHRIGDIGAADRQRSADHHSENQAHVASPIFIAPGQAAKRRDGENRGARSLRLAIAGSRLPGVSVASTVCADAAAQSNAVAGPL
jgi:hypothetical protein